MENLLSYWTGLKPHEKEAMAESLDTSVPYLSQLAHGHRKAGKHLRRLIEEYMQNTDVSASAA